MTWTRQRQFPRFRAAVPVELRTQGNSAPLRAQTGDICQGGCYVEMTATQQIAKEVEITLWIGEKKVVAQGVVVSNHPSFGNGIKFTRVADDSKEQLAKFLESLNPFRRTAKV